MFVPLDEERITLSIQTVNQAILQIRPFAAFFEGCSLFCLMVEQRATNERQQWDLFATHTLEGHGIKLHVGKASYSHAVKCFSAKDQMWSPASLSTLKQREQRM